MTPERAPEAPGSLVELLTGLGATMPDALAERGAGGRVEWSRGGVTFAVVDADGAEIRLDGPIAAAAVRTPDAAPSGRGTPWIRFAPRELDGHAVDRATAWFGLAYRRATIT